MGARGAGWERKRQGGGWAFASQLASVQRGGIRVPALALFLLACICLPSPPCRDEYEDDFSEFDRPVDVAALRSLTPSPERQQPAASKRGP